MAYDHLEIEGRWQRYWNAHGTFRARRRSGRPKRYVLDMFPYPSGVGLHVGHPEGYTATDIMARAWRMRGFDVLHPMGWDAFGLPAEQHAIETGQHPARTTAHNIATFKRQLKMLGFSYDWAREIDTTDPALRAVDAVDLPSALRRGLAYQADRARQLVPGARHRARQRGGRRRQERARRTPGRSHAPPTMDAEDHGLCRSAAEDLSLVDWPEGTLTAQRRWIGRSEGAEIIFEVDGHPDARVAVFTTRPDTLMGATYMVLAPEHALTRTVATPAQREAVGAYVAAAARKSDLDRVTLARTKTGVPTGAFAIHPLTGASLPIWVADYVLGGYGTGAVMAVPAHDERDFEFATAFSLPIVEVVSPDGTRHDVHEAAYVDDGINVRSGELDGLATPEAKRAVVRRLEGLGRGRAKVNYKLRDWVFSRQRYWGEPIPIYFPVDLEDPTGDPRRGAPHTIRYDQPIAVDESELPLRLPELDDFNPGEDPAGPLARAVDWRFFQHDGRWFARETNTMPQWAGSCWYYLRFLDPDDDDQPWARTRTTPGCPSTSTSAAPSTRCSTSSTRASGTRCSSTSASSSDPEPFMKLVHQGTILGEDNERMSKSRGNVVNPDDIVRQYGADALRLYEMFMGPLEAVKPWQTSQIQGVVRFRDRLYGVGHQPLVGEMDDLTRRLLHRTVKKVTTDIEAMAFNTAISTLMVLVNHLARLPAPPRDAVRALVLLVSPFAPHVAEELWRHLGHAESLAYEPWPTWDERLAVEDVIEMPVQVNGKVRGRVQLARDASEADARAAALAADGIGARLAGQAVRKFVYVPGQVVNLVVG